MNRAFKDTAHSLYRWLSSIRTSVYLFALLTVFYFLGTLFPQGADVERYAEAGGRFVEAVRIFGLLHLFQTPLFYLAALLLFANLTVCTWDRFRRLRRGGWREKADIEESLELTLSPQECEEIIERFIKTHRLRRRTLPEATIGAEKGIYYRYLTLGYHAAIVVCFVGFMLTGLFVKEGLLFLRAGEPAAVSSHMMPEVRGWLATEQPPPFKIELERFWAEHILSRRLDYPKDPLSRLAIALGWRNIAYKEQEHYYPKDWFSKLKIIEAGTTAAEKTIEVNDPLRYRGYTFYQVGFKEELKIKIDNKVFTITAGKTKKINNTTFKFYDFRSGRLFKPDGTVEELTPSVAVAVVGADGGLKPMGRLEHGAAMEVDGTQIEFKGFEVVSILSYRYDPGAGLLWYAGFLVFTLMALRCLGRWYMVGFHIEETDHRRTHLGISIRCRGLMADPQRLRLLVRKDFENYSL